MRVIFKGLKHADAESYYIRCVINNEKGDTIYTFALDSAIHRDAADAKYLAERLNAMVADVARHAREDAITETVNRIPFGTTPDAATAARVFNDATERRADMRACMAALLGNAVANAVYDVDAIASEALDAADAIARKLGIESLQARVTGGLITVNANEVEKLNAIRNAAIAVNRTRIQIELQHNKENEDAFKRTLLLLSERLSA